MDSPGLPLMVLFLKNEQMIMNEPDTTLSPQIFRIKINSIDQKSYNYVLHLCMSFMFRQKKSCAGLLLKKVRNTISPQIFRIKIYPMTQDSSNTYDTTCPTNPNPNSHPNRLGCQWSASVAREGNLKIMFWRKIVGAIISSVTYSVV